MDLEVGFSKISTNFPQWSAGSEKVDVKLVRAADTLPYTSQNGTEETVLAFGMANFRFMALRAYVLFKLKMQEDFSVLN